MNEQQRSVLQRHYTALASDIIVTDDLLGSLFQKKVLERNTIEQIKAEKTNTDQIHKLLEVLPRRGPEAFDHFLDSIKEEYPWLATNLETGLRSETLTRQNSLPTMCICGGAKADTDNTPRVGNDLYVPDSDIKARVGMFIHKQFGQSKRVSQQDKKTMEKWMAEQIQHERKILRKLLSVPAEESNPTQDQASNLANHQQLSVELKRVFHKVHGENSSDTASECSTKSDDLDDVDGISSAKIVDLVPVVRQLETEVDQLINKINDLEGQIIQCYYLLGDPDKKMLLTSLVKQLQMHLTQAEHELKSEKKKNEKMLYEIYDYSKTIHKYENEKVLQRHKCEKLEEEMSQLRRHNHFLQEKCSTLESANLQHIEKEKTLENLRKMVKDLQTSKKQVDENANLMSLAAPRWPKKNIRGGRRGSVVEANIGVSMKKAITKQVGNGVKRRPTRPTIN